MPVRLRPRPPSHLRTRLAFRPWDRATAAIDAPGSLQADRTLALSSALCRRRGTGLECIGVHQSNRWTPSSPQAQGQTRWNGWTLTDRLTHHCHIVETGNESYRFRNSSTQSKREEKRRHPNMVRPLQIDGLAPHNPLRRRKSPFFRNQAKGQESRKSPHRKSAIT